MPISDQVTFSGATVINDQLTFTDANYNLAQIVTVTAVDDDLKEGFHTDYITHTLTSDDVDTYPSVDYQVDGDPITVGVNDIPSRPIRWTRSICSTSRWPPPSRSKSTTCCALQAASR